MALGSFGVAVLVPLLFVTAMIVLVVRRGLQMKLLVSDGIDTTGTVVGKLTFHSKVGTRTHRIRYQYVDGMGATHSHRSAVTHDTYRSLAEGHPLAILYSRSKPQISAPKYLVDQARAALSKKKG